MNLENVDYSHGDSPRRSFLARLRGAMLVDASVYEEVEHDPSAMMQAAAVVALAAVAGALAQPFGAALGRSLVEAFLSWGIGTAIVWGLGVKLLGHTSDYPELLRTLGFGQAPRIFLVAAALPLGPLRGLIALAAIGLSVLAWVIATRQALDVTTGRAVAICVLAFVVSVVISLLLPGL
ncbi:MAG: YIP1 family protein [Myxococcota bacterium]